MERIFTRMRHLSPATGTFLRGVRLDFLLHTKGGRDSEEGHICGSNGLYRKVHCLQTKKKGWFNEKKKKKKYQFRR